MALAYPSSSIADMGNKLYINEERAGIFFILPGRFPEDFHNFYLYAARGFEKSEKA